MGYQNESNCKRSSKKKLGVVRPIVKWLFVGKVVERWWFLLNDSVGGEPSWDRLKIIKIMVTCRYSTAGGKSQERRYWGNPALPKSRSNSIE